MYGESVLGSTRTALARGGRLAVLTLQVRCVNDDPADIARQLVELRIEHRDLDGAIARLSADPHCDELQLKRLKKRKLRLKDMIAWLESKLIPDLDA